MIGLKGVRRPVHVDNFAVFVRLAQGSSAAPHRRLLARVLMNMCRVSTQVPPVRYDADKDDLICVTGFFVHPHPASHTHTSACLYLSLCELACRVCAACVGGMDALWALPLRVALLPSVSLHFLPLCFFPLPPSPPTAAQ
jgi:hypothetical protein